MTRANPRLLLIAAAGLLVLAAMAVLPFQGTHRAATVRQPAKKVVATPCVAADETPHYGFYDSHKEWPGAAAPSIAAPSVLEVVRNYRRLICGSGSHGGDPAQLATAEAALKGYDQQMANHVPSGRTWADKANAFDAHAGWAHAKVKYLPDTKVADTTIMMVGTPHHGAPQTHVIPAPHRSSWFLVLPVDDKNLYVRILCAQPYGVTR